MLFKMLQRCVFEVRRAKHLCYQFGNLNPSCQVIASCNSSSQLGNFHYSKNKKWRNSVRKQLSLEIILLPLLASVSRHWQFTSSGEFLQQLKQKSTFAQSNSVQMFQMRLLVVEICLSLHNSMR